MRLCVRATTAPFPPLHSSFCYSSCHSYILNPAKPSKDTYKPYAISLCTHPTEAQHAPPHHLTRMETDDVFSCPRLLFCSRPDTPVIYVLMCLCYDAVLSAAAITSSSTIALETVQGTLGNWAFVTIGVLVSVSVLGSLNASVMTGGRLFFAGGRDGDLPAVMATLSKGTRAPWVALIAQATVVCVLLLLPGSSFNNLVAYFGSASWLWCAAFSCPLSRFLYHESWSHAAT